MMWSWALLRRRPHYRMKRWRRRWNRQPVLLLARPAVRMAVLSASPDAPEVILA